MQGFTAVMSCLERKHEGDGELRGVTENKREAKITRRGVIAALLNLGESQSNLVV